MNDLHSNQINIAIGEIEKRVKQKSDCFCVRFPEPVLDTVVEQLKEIQFVKVVFSKMKPNQVIVTINYNKLNKIRGGK